MMLERQADYLEALGAVSRYMVPTIAGTMPTGLCGATHATTLRALRYLETLGYVRRTEHVGAPCVPRRLTGWSLTDDGKRLVRKVRPQA